MEIKREKHSDGGWWNDEITESRGSGDEALTSVWRTKFLYDALTFLQRQTAVLCPIVQVFMQEMPDRETESASG
ncbi:hypothetical protein JCM15831A_03290 [Asaia astilbis]